MKGGLFVSILDIRLIFNCSERSAQRHHSAIRKHFNKTQGKIYHAHTGYPGGQRILTARQIMEKHPERLIEKAVRGMLPKNKLGNALYKNLKVYVGTEHNHDAQKPEAIKLDSIK